MAGLYFSGAISSREEEDSKPPYSPPQYDSQSQQESTVDFEKEEAIHPPLPEGGLPSGWTIEQWEYYGQQWLDRQNWDRKLHRLNRRTFKKVPLAGKSPRDRHASTGKP